MDRFLPLTIYVRSSGYKLQLIFNHPSEVVSRHSSGDFSANPLRLEQLDLRAEAAASY
jgi:hypothetical protein